MTVLLTLPLNALKAAANLILNALEVEEKTLEQRAKAEYLITMGY